MAKQNRSEWDSGIIKIGSSTLALVAFSGFLPSLYLYFFHGVSLSLSLMASAAIQIWIVYGAFYPIEPLTYYPSLGMAGTYMGWLAGSVGNMRVPSAVVAKQSCGVEDGTKEAEICTIMAIAGSIIVGVVILTIGVALGSQVMDKLPPIVTTALNNYLLPGVFGGMFGLYGTKYPKLAVPCFIVIVALNYASSVLKVAFLPNYVVLAIAVFGSIAVTRIMYKKGMIG